MSKRLGQVIGVYDATGGEYFLRPKSRWNRCAILPRLFVNHFALLRRSGVSIWSSLLCAMRWSVLVMRAQ